jgi:hypothetical protein
MENVGGFSLFDSHFLCQGNHIVDFFGENVQREVVGHAFSSVVVELWSHGCACLPSPGLEALDAGARG